MTTCGLPATGVVLRELIDPRAAAVVKFTDGRASASATQAGVVWPGKLGAWRGPQWVPHNGGKGASDVYDLAGPGWRPFRRGRQSS